MSFSQVDRGKSSIYDVYFDDVDALFSKAVSAGTKVLNRQRSILGIVMVDWRTHLDVSAQ
ncbi:MAG TPA: hypothetical protein VFY55_08840 [Nitrososphaeraceae archaeon]|nr:hypothetical protein [Nitrososphaeraceae archaeon]